MSSYDRSCRRAWLAAVFLTRKARFAAVVADVDPETETKGTVVGIKTAGIPVTSEMAGVNMFGVLITVVIVAGIVAIVAGSTMVGEAARATLDCDATLPEDFVTTAGIKLTTGG